MKRTVRLAWGSGGSASRTHVRAGSPRTGAATLPEAYDRRVTIVIVLFAVVVVLAAVTAWVAVGAQRSRVPKGDEEWLRKVRAEYRPPPDDDWDD